MDIMLACSVLSVHVRQHMGPVGKGAIQHDTLQVYPVTARHDSKNSDLHHSVSLSASGTVKLQLLNF